jgi:hypothetical protein
LFVREGQGPGRIQLDKMHYNACSGRNLAKSAL